MIRRLILASVLLALIFRVWWVYETESPLGRPVIEMVIPPGTSSLAIAEKLQTDGVVPRSWSFSLLVRLRGDGARLKAGRYRFSGPYSLLDVEQKLADGDIERRDVTFPEGRNMFEMAEIVSKAGLKGDAFLVAAKDASVISDLDPEATSLEGYLFPDTYDLNEGYTEAALVADMVKHTREVFKDLGLSPGGRAMANETLTLRQIVTLASIVELETASPPERPRIAGLFLNRLRIGMPLQTDPTIIYAMKLEGQYHGNIRKTDLQMESPYNTYRVNGLPPGPIGSPGRSALEAVFSPDATEDLYFVSRNDGTHVFSKTLHDHERAVDAYQRHRSSADPSSKGAAASPSPSTTPTPSLNK
jgi:UPF0755 protein